MHTLLKPIAVAVLALAAVSASAQVAGRIDAGNDTGNGQIFFSLWDGATSYTRGTSLTINDLIAGVAAPGLYSFTLAADPLLRTWLGTATTSNIEWGFGAVDGLGARRFVSSHTPGAAVRVLNAVDQRNLLVTITDFVGTTNDALRETPSATVSVTGRLGEAHYGGGIRFGINNSGALGFSRIGTELSNSIDNGVNLRFITAGSVGNLPAVHTAMTDGGMPLRGWIDFNSASPTFGEFNVAAVPEPETYAMLLAGLGLMGAIAARRRQRG